MPKGKNQKMKLVRLYKLMLHETDEDHALTNREIREKLEEEEVTVDRKTLYNDLESLQEMGLTIDKLKGGNDTNYHVTGKKFELAELKLMVDAIQSSKFITEKKSTQLIGKLTDFASKYEAVQLERQVIVAGRIKTENESIYYNVDAIHRGIAEDLQISFRYMQWNLRKQLVPRREKRYCVSPWAVTWDAGNYYLLAYDGEAGIIKTYRVDKIKNIRVLDRSREGEDVFGNMNMAVYSREKFSMFSGEEREVTLRFENDMAGVLIDRFGKDIPIARRDGEHAETTVTVGVSPQFYGWIFGLGGKVEITGPADILQGYKTELKKEMEIYGTP